MVIDDRSIRSFEGERKKNDRFKILRLKKMSANNDGSIDEDRTRFSFPIQISKQLIGVFKRFNTERGDKSESHTCTMYIIRNDAI